MCALFVAVFFSMKFGCSKPERLVISALPLEKESKVHADTSEVIALYIAPRAEVVKQKTGWLYGSVSEETKKEAKEYVSRYASIALAEQKKFGIPASIKLAQGLLESNIGKSDLAKKNNNHFGIKCFQKRCHKGHCTNHYDDHHKDFFRNYQTVWQSYRDHSVLLSKPRYAELKRYDVSNYEAWALGLKRLGYATDKNYAKKIINIIEILDLYQFSQNGKTGKSV